MPSGISIADLFASLDLDASGFDSKLSAAKVGLVTAANDMALPIGNVNQLLQKLTKQVGPTAAIEGMVQLTTQGNTALESVRSLIAGIDQLNAVQKQNASIQADAIQRQVEMFQRDQSAAQEALRMEREISAARDAAGKEDSAREDHRLSQAKAVSDQIAQFDKDLAAAESAQIKSRESAEKELTDTVTASYRKQAEAEAAATAARNASIAGLRSDASALTQLGIGLLAAFAPLDAAVAGSSKSFADFDSALTHSLSIMGDVSAGLRDQLAAAAVELSTKFAFSAKDIAGSIYSIGSAGFTAEQALSVLPTVVKFASAAFTDLDSATKLLTTSQNALGLTSTDLNTNLANLTRIGDVLVKADTLATGTSKQFAEALSVVGGTMRQLNVPLETGVAALAVFAKAGITGAEAGTQLGIVLRDLSTKAITHAKAWEKLNVDVYDSQGNFNNLGNIITQLNEHFAGLSAEQVRFDLIQSGIQQRSQKFILTMLGIGDAVTQFEDTLKGAGGTMDQVSTKNLETFSKQLELLKNSVTALALEFGGSLVGELNKFTGAGGPLKTLIDSLTQNFHDLDPSVKAVVADLSILGVVGGTGAAGLALVGGQVLRMAADLKVLGASMEGLNALLGVGSASAAAGLIGLMGVSLVTAIVAATKQWDDYKDHLQQVYDKQKQFYDLYNKQHPSATGGNSSQATTFTPEASFNATEGAAASKVYGDFKVTIDGVTDSTKKLSGAALDLSNDQKTMAKEAAAARSAFSEQNSIFRDEAKTINEAVATQQRYTNELKAFGVAVNTTNIASLISKINDLKEGLDAGQVSQENYDQALRAFHDLTSLTTADMDKIAQEATNLNSQIQKVAAKQQFQDIKNGVGAVGESFTVLTKSTMDAIAAMAPLRSEPKAVTDAFKDLGLKSTVQLDELAAKAQRDFDIIRSSGMAAPKDIERAWVKLQEAQMNAGKEFSTAQLLIIAEIEEATKNASNKIYDLAKSVSREVTHLVDNMANTFVSGLASLFDNSGNNKIEQQISDLNADMEAHAAAWQKTQADAAAAIQKINSDLAISIADLQSKSADALQKETDDYNKFVSDTNAKLASVVTTHQQEMAKEVKAVNDGLKDQRDAYDQFVRDTQDQLQQLVRSHAEAQAQIRNDAAKSLRDETTDYQRFVEDTNESIRKAQAEGDTQQIADLQKSLQRRTEDYNTFQQDLADKTAEQLRQDQEAQAQSTADLQKSLEDKKAALDKAQADAINQIAEITKAQQAALAADLQGLQDQLAQKSKEYEDFKKQNALDLASAIKEAQDKAAADIKAQQDSLEQQKADYEAYLKDYRTKLADLQAQHKSVFDKIGDMFKAMLTGFATDLGKFIASELFKTLLGDLRKKLDDAIGIKAIGGGMIPTGSGGSPVQLPTEGLPPGGNVDLSGVTNQGPTGGGGMSTESGSGEGAVSSLGSLTSVVGAIGSAVTAISSVIGNFQMARLETTMNAVEQNTRFTEIYLHDLFPTFLDYLPQLVNLQNIWGVLLEQNQILRDVAADIHYIAYSTGGTGKDNIPLDARAIAQQEMDIQNALNAIANAPVEGFSTPSSVVPSSNVSNPLAMDQNTSSVASNTYAVSTLTSVIQGAAPQQLGVIPGSQQDLRNREAALENSGPLSPSGQLAPGGSALGSDAAKLQAAAIQALAPVSAAGAYGKGVSLSNPVSGTVNPDLINFAGGNGQGRSGFDTLSNTFQYQQYAQPYGPQGANTGDNLTVNINVPNPDGDVVAQNFIGAVEKRGVRLR